MAKIRSGNLILDSGQRIYIEGEVIISRTTMSGVDELYIDNYYGDGTYLTGIPRSLVGLLDFPVTYSGAGGKYLRVKSSEDGLEFVTFSGSESNYYTKPEIDTISGSLHSKIEGIEIDIDGVRKFGLTTVTSGSSSVSVTFGESLSSSDYVLSTLLSNIVDTPLDLYSMITTEKETTGFTVKLSGDVEYSNYYLEWMVVDNGIDSSESTSSTAVVGGGTEATASTAIDYFNIASIGNASDFGDMTRARNILSATSNGTNDRGILAFGPIGYNNIMDYVTISTPGNAIVFGYLSLSTRGGYGAATSNNTNERGIYAGEGNTPTGIHYWTISTLGNTTSFGTFTSLDSGCAATSNGTNERGVYSGHGNTLMGYITISTTGNSTTFGTITVGRDYSCSTSNLTNERGLIIGGQYNGNTYYNNIDYITISTTGNATDFGDLLSTLHNRPGATSNGTDERGVICGGKVDSSQIINTIQYITISTLGNSTDFGDLIIIRDTTAATSNA
jgi:hypothetical protein